MIVEVRTYKVKEGFRECFLDFFQTRSIPAQRAAGMKITGPLIDIENPDVFIWLRAFPSLEDRDRIKDAFYGSDLWKNELEAIAMPMLESFSTALTTLPPWFVDDLRTDGSA
jgi:hypothetical protein